MAEHTYLCLNCGRVFTLKVDSQAGPYRVLCPVCGSERVSIVPEGINSCSSG